MGWLRLRFDVDVEGIEQAEKMLESAGALSLTVTDAGDQPVLEPAPGETPLWRDCRLEALFELDADVAVLRQALSDVGHPRVAIDFLDDADWQNRWRRHAVRRCFGDRLWLLPKDEEPSAGPTLRLDPGLAFGSGGHPTTRLCLEWLAGQTLEGRTVLDYGCGSGILGLAALKLGCACVLAVDHDPQALLATRENATYNALSGEGLEVGMPEAAAGRMFDVVLANILANPLIELAPRLNRALVPGGALVMSGMLEAQAPDVVRAYPTYTFEDRRVASDEQENCWICLVGRRPIGTTCGASAESAR